MLLLDQRYRWRTPEPLRVEEYLRQVPELRDNHHRVLELVVGEFQSRLSGVTVVSIDEYTAKFSHFGNTLHSQLQQLTSGSDAAKVAHDGSTNLETSSNIDHREVVKENYPERFEVESDPTEYQASDQLNPIVRIGRYRQVRLLGKRAYPLYGDSGFPQDWPLDLEKPSFRLPTEAEWEIAARGGMRTTFGFGEDQSLLDRYAWFQKNSNRQTHVAKELRPNLRGLFDLHGSVFEWSHDWYADYATTSSQVNPKGGQTSSSRVGRGGGWRYDAADCRAAMRFTAVPTLRAIGGGRSRSCARHGAGVQASAARS